MYLVVKKPQAYSLPHSKPTQLSEDRHTLVQPQFPTELRGEKRDQLGERSMREVYHLWQLAGGNVEQELKKQKLIRTKPAILTLPR